MWEWFLDIWFDVCDVLDGDDSGLIVWVLGGYVEVFVLMGDVFELFGDGWFLLYGCKVDFVNIVGKCMLFVYLNY